MNENKTYRDRKWFNSVFLPMLLIFLLPMLLIVSIVFLTPPVYDETFVGELAVKYDRLESTNEKKLVIVSGSSAAFGIDSELIKESLGYEPVNFGLYANLGTKLMMDLSKVNINEGDIIVLAPEINSQTLSLYFNPETTAQALDGNFKMLKNIPSDEYESLIGAMWKLGVEKLSYLSSGTKPENVGAYKKENFNEYGDNTYSRPFNEMTGHGNDISFDFLTDYSDYVTTDYEEYIDYVNDYVAYAEKKGATVYFSFPPMNREAVMNLNSQNDIEEFYKNLCESLDCKVISNINDYILDEGYFYDSEFHLNDSGVTVRTVQLIDDIKRELMDLSVTVPPRELPEPSGFKPDSDYFDLRKNSLGRGWEIVGLSEEGKNEKTLVIPSEISGLPVVRICTGAFEGAQKLEALTVGANVRYIDEDALSGAINLGSLIIDESIEPEELSIDGFLPMDTVIYVNENMVSEFKEAWHFNSERIEADISFVFERFGNSLKLTSLTASGLNRTELVIPEEYNGLKIDSIASNAFEGADKLIKLTLSKNISELEDYAFAGASSLETIFLASETTPNMITVPEDSVDLFGEVTDVKIFVNWKLYDKFTDSHEWFDYHGIVTTDNLYFVLEIADGGWSVVGLNESGKSQSVLEIPDTVDGIAVKTIKENAFKDSSAKTVYVGKNVLRIDGKAFSGSSVTSVVIPDGTDASEISVPNNMSESLITDGADPMIKIYVDDDLYSGFASDYFWGDYGSFLEIRSKFEG